MPDEPDGIARTAPGPTLVAELRQDMISGLQVLIAPSRSARPSTVPRAVGARPQPARSSGSTTTARSAPGTKRRRPKSWRRSAPADRPKRDGAVRVVRNRYPVVGGTEGATGECEVMVFRDHDRRLEDLDVDEVAEILAVIRDRVAAQAAHRSSVQVFVNAEAEAGASIAHPHAQIISLDFMPPALDRNSPWLPAPTAIPCNSISTLPRRRQRRHRRRGPSLVSGRRSSRTRFGSPPTWPDRRSSTWPRPTSTALP